LKSDVDIENKVLFSNLALRLQGTTANNRAKLVWPEIRVTCVAVFIFKQFCAVLKPEHADLNKICEIRI